jgi:hypothetical protein
MIPEAYHLTLVMPNEQKLPVNDPQRSVTSNKSHMPASMFVAILKNYLVYRFQMYLQNYNCCRVRPTHQVIHPVELLASQNHI